MDNAGGSDAVAVNAGTAEARGTAFNASVMVVEGAARSSSRASGDIIVIPVPTLPTYFRGIRWTKLEEGPDAWLAELCDEAGHVLDTLAGDSQDDILTELLDGLY